MSSLAGDGTGSFRILFVSIIERSVLLRGMPSSAIVSGTLDRVLARRRVLMSQSGIGEVLDGREADNVLVILIVR